VTPLYPRFFHHAVKEPTVPRRFIEAAALPIQRFVRFFFFAAIEHF
jgi:hypothetical protein